MSLHSSHTKHFEAALKEVNRIPCVNKGGCGLVAYAGAKLLRQLGYPVSLALMSWGKQEARHASKTHANMLEGGLSIRRWDSIRGLSDETGIEIYHVLLCLPTPEGELFADSVTKGFVPHDSKFACGGVISEVRWSPQDFYHLAMNRSGWSNSFGHDQGPRVIDAFQFHFNLSLRTP